MRNLLKKTVLENPWIPKSHRLPREDGKGLTEKQALFLSVPEEEAFYGGAAAGGKSDALLMGALQFVDVPGYSAILFRRTFSDLKLPGALMDRAHEWLGGSSAHWNERDHIYTFPSTAKVAFGYMEAENDKYRYQSAEFQYIGFDEEPQFTETQYLYLSSRQRRLEDSLIPLRLRGAGNPDGPGVEWVYRRFVNPGSPQRPFVPAKLDDNPNVDRVSYVRSLTRLDPITRARLLEGNWEIRGEGHKFKRTWFQIVDVYPMDCQLVRYWDLAATEAVKGKDPAYTAGALVGEKRGEYYIIDVKRDRLTPLNVELLVKQMAQLDCQRFGGRVKFYMEQEPGSAGVNVIDHYRRDVLKGYPFYGDRVTGSKELRADPVSSAAEAGNVKLVAGHWNEAFLDEAVLFPEGKFKDQVDAVSGAFGMLNASPGPMTVSTGRVPW